MLVDLIVFLPFVMAAGAYPLGRKHEKIRDLLVPAFAGIELLLCCLLFGRQGSGTEITGVLSMGLSFTVDGFRTVYALITAFMWFMTSVFSREYFAHEREGLARYYVFWLMTLGATEGVMLSADLMTTFVFFEILSFTSFTWVLHEQTRAAIRAGYTYLFIAVIGGLLLLMGLLLLYSAAGTLTFSELPAAMERILADPSSGGASAAALTNASSAGAFAAPLPNAASPGRLLAAGILILLGFGAKAGMFPLHVWLPKAHPVAPSPGSAILSGVLTKVGIFGILMTSAEAFPAHPMLGAVIYVLGLVTMFLGALLALFSVNLKRTLACSSMSQVGFILTGLGSFVLQGAVAAAHEGAELLSGAGEAVREALAGGAAALSGAGASGTLSALTGEIGEGRVLASSGLMLHMVNHSLLKLALFMIAGVVVMNLHKLNLNEIRGWGRKKPLLKLAFALGGLGISGVPLFNGYISKTMLHEGIVMLIEESEAAGIGAFAACALAASEWIFLISGGLTFAYMMKLFFCIFVEKNADPAVQAVYDGGSAADAASKDCVFASGSQRPPKTSETRAAADGNAACRRRPYMNAASAFAILGSAIFMVILGQPAVMTHLAAFMTGNPEILEFHAFTPGNLKGGFISLGIGAAVYLLIVRLWLMRKGVYLDRWPKGLDLEERVYRPLLTKVLPGIFGAIVRIPAENRVSTVLCRGVLAAGKALARFFGENRLLRPVCRGLVFLGTFFGRCLSTGTDALFALLRKTVLRERRVQTAEDYRPGKARTAVRVTEEALRPLAFNFSFALLMTCLGIIVFLVVLLLTIL